MLISYLVLFLDPFISQSYLLPSKPEMGPAYLQRKNLRDPVVSLYKVYKVCQMLKTILNSYQFLQANWGQLLMNSLTHSRFFPFKKKCSKIYASQNLPF